MVCPYHFLSIDKYKFATEFSKFADYVLSHEPTTLSYETAESDKEDNQVVIIERYVNKDAYLNIHKKSAEFLEFRGKLAAMDVEISGHSYYETNTGFICSCPNGLHAGDAYK